MLPILYSQLRELALRISVTGLRFWQDMQYHFKYAHSFGRIAFVKCAEDIKLDVPFALLKESKRVIVDH